MGSECSIATANRLVTAAKAGDTRSFCELVRRYRARVLALSLHLVGDETEAEDITQEVFLRAYRCLPRFEQRSHFFTWIYRMTVNLSLNAIRQRKRRRETPWDDPRIERALTIYGYCSPGRTAELRQTYALLLSALDGLPQDTRTTVVLVALQGLSHQEAATVQGCATGTIGWRMHNARRVLRSALERGPRLRLVSGASAG